MRRSVTKLKPASAGAATPVVARPRFSLWLLAALLVLVTIALYWPATGYDFVNFDDREYVGANPQVQTGLSWEGMKWAFLNPVGGNWHPVTVLSHALDCQIYGVKPWGHHLTSVLLHALNAALVFALLQQMTGAMWRSLFVAALFAVHPLRVESVAWVAERKDVLSGFFGLLALLFYARYAGERSEARSPKPENRKTGGTHHASRFTYHAPRSTPYALSLLCFALGLMSKPMLVTWPFVMLLLDYWPLKRIRNGWRLNSRLLGEKVPFFALAAAASIVTLVVQKRGDALLAAENLPFGVRVANALISYCRYLGKLCWPADLAIYYPYPGHWPLAEVLLAGGLLLGLSLLFFGQRRQFPFLVVGWLWFVGMLVPVIGLVQVGSQAMADRYTYLPSMGVLILAVWGACELSRRWWRQPRIALSLGGAAAIVLCLAVTRQQLGHWQDSETLFRHALEVTKGNCLAYNGLGSALAEKGRVDEAIGQYQQALRLKPNNGYAHNNLGSALHRQGRNDEAIPHFEECVRLQPDYAFAYFNLANAFQEKGQLEDTIRAYQAGLKLKPDEARAHNNLGAAFSQQGRIGEAVSQYQEALRLQPDYADARNNLDAALAAPPDPLK
jgi:tetratricopeptide (TPR) repeat protein